MAGAMRGLFISHLPPPSIPRLSPSPPQSTMSHAGVAALAQQHLSTPLFPRYQPLAEMADNSLNVIDDFDFHPYNVPKGTKNYTFADLTQEQKTKLNQTKLSRIRENQKYLAAHPEVRAIIAIILRLVMKQRPSRNVGEYIAKYFLNASEDIRGEVKNYLEQRAKLMVIKDSRTRIRDEDPISETSLSFATVVKQSEAQLKTKVSDDDPEPAMICSEIVEDIFEKVFNKIDGIETTKTFVGGGEFGDLQKTESAYSLCSIGFLADESVAPAEEGDGGSAAGSMTNILEDA